MSTAYRRRKWSTGVKIECAVWAWVHCDASYDLEYIMLSALSSLWCTQWSCVHYDIQTKPIVNVNYMDNYVELGMYFGNGQIFCMLEEERNNCDDESMKCDCNMTILTCFDVWMHGYKGVHLVIFRMCDCAEDGFRVLQCTKIRKVRKVLWSIVKDRIVYVVLLEMLSNPVVL